MSQEMVSLRCRYTKSLAAGNRWHIDCFRCNTCGTLLDSDANLLLLGDGSLICNNCTYSCSACGSKIEDLAILTGDQAFCATCFKCRNCKKKIENLKYARTSQGIFCMECHESLMQRRRKKSAKNSERRHKHHQQLLPQVQHSTMLLDKSLPKLPPNAVTQPFSPENAESPLGSYSDTPTEIPRLSLKRPGASRSNSYSGTPTDTARTAPKRPPNLRSESSREGKREESPATRPGKDDRKGSLMDPVSISSRKLTKAENLTLPSTAYKRHSGMSQKSDTSVNGEDFYIPMALDTNPVPVPSPFVTEPEYESPPDNFRPQLTETDNNSRDYFNPKGTKSTVRKVSQDQANAYVSPLESPRNSRPSSGPSSPHIAYQEIGRESNHDNSDYARKRRDHSIPGALAEGKTRDVHHETPSRPNGEARNGKFTLGEVPKNRKASHSAKSSKSETTSPVTDTLGASKPKITPSSANAPVKEQRIVSPQNDSPASIRQDADFDNSSLTTQDSKNNDNASLDSSTSHSSPITTQLRLPQRGDSLAKSADARAPSRRDESSGRGKISTKLRQEDLLQGKPSSAPPTATSEYPTTTYPNVNGHKGTLKSIDSPTSISNSEIPHPPPRARERVVQTSISEHDAFHTPRAPPQVPAGHHKSRNESISTITSESPRNGEYPGPPKLPIRFGGGDISADEDLARILSNDAQQDHSSILRRFSNSVRHRRSYSDRGIRISKEQKWPKSPLNGGSFTQQELSSPTSSSPEAKEELAWFKNELRRERQRTLDKEQKLEELEAALEANTNIRQMNTELREKRSTMIVLDTQKEIVVRELEVLTERIVAAKNSGEPLDVGKMTNVVVREFAESLQKLKDSFQPQIEDLTQKRNDLLDEVASLTLSKDKSFSEFEQLSLKNAQLAELNNDLVHQIQELYKANAGPALDVVRPPPNGLGIYTHHQKDGSTVSIHAQQQRPSIAESNITGSTTVPEQDQGDATYLSAPQVVNIKRAQPKKFNWKKGGQNVAKGVTKGLKGAFKSDEAKLREGHFEGGVPYGSIPPNQEFSLGSVPKSQIHDPSRQGFGFFGTQKKPIPQQQWSSQQPSQQVNGSAPQSAGGPQGNSHVTDFTSTVY